MAYLREVKSQDTVKKMRIGDLRNEYNALAERYTRITKCDDLVCPSCGRLKTAKKENFYADTEIFFCKHRRVFYRFPDYKNYQ